MKNMLIIMLVIAMVFTIWFLVDNLAWNDGYCPLCGGHWEFRQAIGGHRSTTYLYICENCGYGRELSVYHGE